MEYSNACNKCISIDDGVVKMMDNLWFNVLVILVSLCGFILVLVDMTKYKIMSALFANLMINLIIINIMIFLTKTLQIIGR